MYVKSTDQMKYWNWLNNHKLRMAQVTSARRLIKKTRSGALLIEKLRFFLRKKDNHKNFVEWLSDTTETVSEKR